MNPRAIAFFGGAPAAGLAVFVGCSQMGIANDPAFFFGAAVAALGLSIIAGLERLRDAIQGRQ
jgi:hypothetical protein